jgi:hypothetical protein
MRRESPWVAAILCAVLILLPIVYCGSYFLLVEVVYVPFAPNDGTTITLTHEAGYRRAEMVAKPLFLPMHWIDRRLRPETWRDSSLHELGGEWRSYPPM